jgi:hypothetical protein
MSGALLSHPSTDGAGTPSTVFHLRDMGQVSHIVPPCSLAGPDVDFACCSNPRSRLSTLLTCSLYNLSPNFALVLDPTFRLSPAPLHLSFHVRYFLSFFYRYTHPWSVRRPSCFVSNYLLSSFQRIEPSVVFPSPCSLSLSSLFLTQFLVSTSFARSFPSLLTPPLQSAVPLARPARK